VKVFVFRVLILQVETESEVSEFLSVLKIGTRNVYRRGLEAFNEFYSSKGSIRDFLDCVERDRLLPRNQRKRVDRMTLNNFVTWLQNRGYSPKTIRIYVGAVQSLAKYFDVPISLRYVQLPPAHPVNKKHPWTTEEVGEFIATMDKLLYRSIAASIVQSGLSVSDLPALTYGDIKEEFEKGTTPICLSLTRKKTGVSFITFLGSWSVKLLKDYLTHEKLDNETPIYNVSSRAVHAYFRKMAQKFAGNFKGRNPYSPHSLRAAFRTFLSDHKVDTPYIEYWMGHALPEQQGAYINKSVESWRQTYRQQAEPWLTPPQYKENTHVN
jgi:integrase